MRKCVLIAIFTLVFSLSNAQNYGTYALYIYSFTKYVQWPDDMNQGDFEIYVLGDSPILPQLKKMEEIKKVGDRSIKVIQINSPLEIKKCHILFVSLSKSAQWNEITTKVNSQPILMITEEPGMGQKGSHINFIMKDGKAAFELNKDQATKQNLKISNQLLSMAILI